MTQLPSPQSRLPAPQHVKRVRPKTYSVAVYLVVILVFFQVGMVVVVFWLRAMVVPVNVHLPKAQPGLAVTPPLVGPELPKNSASASQPQLPNLPNLRLNLSRPALLAVPAANDELQQVSSLNDEAQAFLHQHLLESAVDTLLKAEDIDPRYPDTLKNLADTYNLMNDPVRSKIYWQRLVDIGPAVGTVYQAAMDHLVLMNGNDSNPLNNSSTLVREIYINSVEKTPVDFINGKAQFHLRATLSMRPPRMPVFDQKKLQPYVIFYQQMPDGSLVPDLAQHKGSFDDTFLFWGTKSDETLGVDYFMPTAGETDPNGAPMGKYYGFVIGIYYDKILQDARSEPADLITRIPLPAEIE